MPFLESISIQGYKSFVEKQTFPFAVPNGDPGSGLTVVVGPNRAGKSTFLEAFTKLRDGSRLGEEERNDKEFLLEFTQTNSAETTALEKNSHVFYEDMAFQFTSVEMIPSRRRWESEFSQAMNYEEYYQYPPAWQGNAQDQHFAGLLKKITENDTKLRRFNEMVRRVLYNFESWRPNFALGKDFIEYKSKSGTRHQIGFSGDGLISVFRILAYIAMSESDTEKTLVIDEPELSLQPAAQKEIANLVFEVSAGKQIIIASHSPYFVNFDAAHNGGQIIRVDKVDDHFSDVYVFRNDADYAKWFFDSRKRWNRPFSQDIVAKEIFFLNNIVFVEGQEDVGLIRKFLFENNIRVPFELYGYGVDGTGALKKHIQFAEEMGLSVGVIVDKGWADLPDLKTEFEPKGVKFIELKAQDIRDKYSKKMEDGKCVDDKSAPLKVEGYFDSNGNIKDDCENKIKEHIQELTDHFEPA